LSNAIIVQNFQPSGHGLDRVCGDYTIGDVLQPVAVNVDQTPTGETQAGINP
jgi:hypothetical protein